VLQLLHIDGPVPAKLLAEWVLPDGLSKHKVAVDRLVQLRVFVEALDRYLRLFSLEYFHFLHLL
jgi:transcription initiation factor TFIIH subunit 4